MVAGDDRLARLWSTTLAEVKDLRLQLRAPPSGLPMSGTRKLTGSFTGVSQLTFTVSDD